MNTAEISVLVVDDVNAMRVEVEALLKQFGFKIVKAVGTVAEAEEYMDKNDVHLVLCDWHMEPTDGLDFLNFVRTHPKFLNLAFVMVTAEGTKEQVVEAIQAGVDDYLMKPLTLGQIQSKVFNVLLIPKDS